MHCNILLNDNKSIPQTAFTDKQQNENSLIVENKFNPIPCTNHVNLGTELKALNAFFEEKSNSLHLFIIFNFSFKETKQEQHCVVFLSLKNIFLLTKRLDIC